MITGTKNVAGVPAAQRQPRERQQRRRQKRNQQQRSDGKEGHHDAAPLGKMANTQELDEAIVIDIVGRRRQSQNNHASTATKSLEPSRPTGNPMRHVDIRI